jgi:cysteinyl-tRNA synthetase
MIKYVQTILDKNLAYIDSGSVYLRRSSLDQVGCLSGRHIEYGLLGEKNHNEHKEHDADFALWKAAKDCEIAWSAPWGSGRPGWHLECSVMIHEIFKTQSLDIHGGGLDLLFPHHENEIYQCKAHGEETLATYWMHNNMLNFGDKKMSKSLGNVLTGRKFISEQSGELLKYVILSHHYRTVIDFSEQSIKEHEKQLAKFYQSIKKAKKLETNIQEESLFDYLKLKIDAALADDFNTPLAFSYIYEANNFLNKNAKYAKSYLNLISYFGNIFSLFEEDAIEYLSYLDTKELKSLNVTLAEIEGAIKKRKEYRDNKQYDLADEVRKDLLKKNIALLDYASDTEFEIIRN